MLRLILAEINLVKQDQAMGISAGTSGHSPE